MRFTVNTRSGRWVADVSEGISEEDQRSYAESLLSIDNRILASGSRPRYPIELGGITWHFEELRASDQTLLVRLDRIIDDAQKIKQALEE